MSGSVAGHRGAYALALATLTLSASIATAQEREPVAAHDRLLEQRMAGGAIRIA